MNIGILTFHWATNYGAILQAFCLQEYLREQGHVVKIINYKPREYDFSWFNYVKHPLSILHLFRDLITKKKESLLVPFRDKYLNMTSRYYESNQVALIAKDFDVLISGSDQILNPWFTTKGEKGQPCSVYYLNCGDKKVKKIGYSVSFGYEFYPDFACHMAKDWINNFDCIGFREISGQDVLKQLRYKGPSQLTPDPTLLLGSSIFSKILGNYNTEKNDYLCVYMLRKVIQIEGNVKYIDERHRPINMDEWLKTIIHAKGFITNSYHGMIIAILAHVPFAVLLETGKLGGMNDRFKTLMNQLGITDRMCCEVNDAIALLEKPIDFSIIEDRLESFRSIGVSFLNTNIN